MDFARYAGASKAVTSPDNAAAALQRASQRDEIYARKPQAPLENLELLSGTGTCFLNLTYIRLVLNDPFRAPDRSEADVTNSVF